MDRIRRLRSPIRDYAWGSRTALARLTGRPAPTAGPEAELWLGAHPAAPSQVETEAGPVSLLDWIRRDPEAVLGVETARRFDGQLPFLFKLLAPERALSIQTHPDARQARAGFERENARGLAPDDPRRSYRDPNPKPELICALEPFTALCGFRPPAEIAAGLGALHVAALEPVLRCLRASPGRAGLEAFLTGLLELEAEARRSLVGEVAQAAARGGGDERALAWVEELARQHPGDTGALAPLVLNLIELAPGEALFLAAGELHAYLRGVGVELMANSDNVLRGGLTGKHVDVPELLRTLTFREGRPPRLRPRERSVGEGVYPTPAAEFELSVLRVEPQRAFEGARDRSVEILLCVEGEAEAHDPARGEAVPLPRGAAVLVPAALPAYQLRGLSGLRGTATVYRAGVPH